MATTPNSPADASVAGEMREPFTTSTEPLTTERAKNLADLEEQISAISRRFTALVEASGAERCSRRPAPGSWSASECIEHLNITADAYFPVWQQMIASAGPRKAESSAPYAIDFWGRLLSWILEPPVRIRSKAAMRFQPIEGVDTSDVFTGFVERQQRIMAALRRCRGRAIDEVKMASPADPRIRYSIWSSFVIVAAHERRHLWQAEQAVKQV